jgi:hypothetical protein
VRNLSEAVALYLEEVDDPHPSATRERPGRGKGLRDFTKPT